MAGIDNPTGLSATILPDSGRDALGVGQQRQAIERQDAANKQAKLDKQNEFTGLDYVPVWDNGKKAVLDKFQTSLNNISVYTGEAQASGQDVRDPSSPYYGMIQREKAGFLQRAEKELQDQKIYTDLRKIYDAEPNSFYPEFGADIDAWAADPNRGAAPSPDEVYDHMAAWNTAFEGLEAEITQYENKNPDASINSVKMSEVKEVRVADKIVASLDSSPLLRNHYQRQQLTLKNSDPTKYNSLLNSAANRKQSFLAKAAQTKDPEAKAKYEALATSWELQDEMAFEDNSQRIKKSVEQNIENAASYGDAAKQEGADLFVSTVSGIASGSKNVYEAPPEGQGLTYNGSGLLRAKKNMLSEQIMVTKKDEDGKEYKVAVEDIYFDPDSGETFLITSEDKVTPGQDLKNSNIAPADKESVLGMFMPLAKNYGLTEGDVAIKLKEKGIGFKGGKTEGIEKVAGEIEYGDDYRKWVKESKDVLEGTVMNMQNQPRNAVAYLTEFVENTKRNGKMPVMSKGGKTFRSPEFKFEYVAPGISFAEDAVRITTVDKETGTKDVTVIPKSKFGTIASTYGFEESPAPKTGATTPSTPTKKVVPGFSDAR